MPEPTEVQTAVAHALADTHAHHDHVIGAPNGEGVLVLWLDGAGEFQDGRWLITRDGKVFETRKFNQASFVPGFVAQAHGRLWLVIDRDGNAIPYPHGEALSRGAFPTLYAAVASAYPERAEEDVVTLPDLRGRVIREPEPF